MLGKTSIAECNAGLQDRRGGCRFSVEWVAKVIKGTPAETLREIVARVSNLSSGGALLCVDELLEIGTGIDILIELPFNRKRWMQYSGEITRIENSDSSFGVAVRFNSFRPKFVEK